MLPTAKYIRTKEDQIVIFSASLQHKTFAYLFPISAGFVMFGVDSNALPTITCYGESISLFISSRPEEDTALAKLHILANGMY